MNTLNLSIVIRSVFLSQVNFLSYRYLCVIYLFSFVPAQSLAFFFHISLISPSICVIKIKFANNNNSWLCCHDISFQLLSISPASIHSLDRISSSDEVRERELKIAVQFISNLDSLNNSLFTLSARQRTGKKLPRLPWDFACDTPIA